MLGTREDLATLNLFLSRIGRAYPDLMYRGASLYHYTDLCGLLGIINTNDIWLSNAQYLNDDEEMKIGYELTTSIVQRLLAENLPGPRKAYLEMLQEGLSKPLPQAYVCSFCEEPGLLSQWRGYGANGSGVSIRFDPHEFSYVTGPDCPYGVMSVWRVYYSREKQEERLRQAIEFFSPEVESEGSAETAILKRWSAPRTTTYDERARKVMFAIQFFVPTFKNPDFSDEREWRLIFSPYPDCQKPVQFRISRNIVVPYYPLTDLETAGLANQRLLPITEIEIGPSVHKTLNASSIRMLLDQRGYKNVVVKVSNTPYRG
jgi:hypothetical protein